MTGAVNPNKPSRSVTISNTFPLEDPPIPLKIVSMLTKNRVGVGPVCLSLLLASSVGMALSAFAEEVSVQGQSRPSNIRTVTRPRPNPSVRPAQPTTRTQMTAPQTSAAQSAPRQQMPRPIQDETTRVPNPPQTAPLRSFGTPTQVQQPTVQQTVPSVTPPPVARPRPAAARGSEQAVDLDALSAPPARPMVASPTRDSSGGQKGSSTMNMNPHASVGGGTIPNFKFFYDFLLKSWKGGGANAGSLTFDNYHQKMLVEYTPNQDFTFSASIIGLDYYEVDYLLSPKFQLRWGKIWIPFDDMSPHNIFGGRLNTSKFFQAGETAFLPDIWADLGVAAKWVLTESSSFTSTLHFYVVNGFIEGGTSPVQGETGVAYPVFAGESGQASVDNNNNKAIGGRWASGFGQKFNFGFSYYTGTYTSKGGVAAADPKGLTIMGGDIQIRPSSTTEIRLGLTSMKVGLASPAAKQDFTRGGSYVELGQRFGQDNRWKFLVRAGKSQNDNRVVDVSDKTLVGFTLLKNFRVFEAQLTAYKDLNKVAAKTAYNYGALRLVTAF